MSLIAVGPMWVDIWNSNLPLLMATLGNMRYVEKQNIIKQVYNYCIPMLVFVLYCKSYHNI